MTNTQTMSGRAYAITGGAGGIGLAVAIGLASRGAALALADIKAEELQKAQKKIAETHPESSLAIAVVDITKRAQVDEWILSTKETFGRIDGCVNAAGEKCRQIPSQVGTQVPWVPNLGRLMKFRG